MKRLALLVFCCILLSIGVCNAEIRRGKVDDFDGSLITSSVNHSIGKMDTLTFIKKYLNSKDIHNFYVNKNCVYEYQAGYAFEKAQLKIDEKIYELKILKQNTNLASYSFGTAYGNISASLDINNELIELIKFSQKVTLRLSDSDGIHDTIEIPNYVLNEWKQVIATEE